MIHRSIELLQSLIYFGIKSRPLIFLLVVGEKKKLLYKSSILEINLDGYDFVRKKKRIEKRNTIELHVKRKNLSELI